MSISTQRSCCGGSPGEETQLRQQTTEGLFAAQLTIERERESRQAEKGRLCAILV